MSALHIHFGKPTALPLDMLLSMIPSLPRHALDRLVERAIDHMDDQDGDGRSGGERRRTGRHRG